MRQQAVSTIKRAAYWAALLFPALGGAWSAAKWADAKKLDVSRFLSDSALIMQHDSTWKSGVMDGLHDLKLSVDSANLRLRQIQCGRRTEEGCR